MKKFMYFHSVVVKAHVRADDEEEAKRRVQENLVLNSTRDVPLIILEPKKNDLPYLIEVDW